jgi:hypothetical protein
MSSASRKSVSHYWTLDWRTTRDLLQPIPDAAALLKAIEDGSSGYQPVAQFGQRSRTIRLRITSLCPTITVYAPNPA